MRVRTSDGVVHDHVNPETFACATAWQTVSVDDRVWGKISVCRTDELVTCLECIADAAPSPRGV